MMKLQGKQTTPRYIADDLTLASIRDEGLQRQLLTLTTGMIGIYGLLLSVISYIATANINPGGIMLASGMLLFLALGRIKKIQPGIAVATVIYMLLFTTASSVLGFGPSIYVLSSFMLGIVLANSLVSTRMGVGAAVYSVIALAAILYFDFSRFAVLTPQAVTMANTFGSAVNIVLASFILIFHTHQVEQRWEQTRQYASALDRQNRRLEGDIERQDREMVKRSRYLNATAAVARDSAATLMDVNQLMQQVATTIGEQLGYYHVGVFLIDSENVWAVLRAASSEGGQAMIARHHRLRVGSQGIVGYVAQTGRPRISGQVEEDTVHLVSPDLPETRSEIALPLVVRGRTLGVLDVQSEIVNAFSDQDVSVLQALADQVAITVMGATRLAEIQAEMESAASGREVNPAQTWRELLGEGERKIFVSDEYALASAETVSRPGMLESLATGTTVIKQSLDAPDNIAIPIRVRGEVVGVINGSKRSATETWTEDDVSLLQALTDQLNIALEGAQLYEDSQRRAARERLVREMTDQMRSAITWEELLQTAVQQMANTVQAPRAFIQWAPPEDEDAGTESVADANEEAANA